MCFRCASTYLMQAGVEARGESSGGVGRSAGSEPPRHRSVFLLAPGLTSRGDHADHDVRGNRDVRVRMARLALHRGEGDDALRLRERGCVEGVLVLDGETLTVEVHARAQVVGGEGAVIHTRGRVTGVVGREVEGRGNLEHHVG